MNKVVLLVYYLYTFSLNISRYFKEVESKLNISTCEIISKIGFYIKVTVVACQ